jgi:hypothetical protein
MMTPSQILNNLVCVVLDEQVVSGSSSHASSSNVFALSGFTVGLNIFVSKGFNIPYFSLHKILSR